MRMERARGFDYGVVKGQYCGAGGSLGKKRRNLRDVVDREAFAKVEGDNRPGLRIGYNRRCQRLGFRPQLAYLDPILRVDWVGWLQV